MTAVMYAPYEHPSHVRADRDLRRRNRLAVAGVVLSLTGGALLLHDLVTALRTPRRRR